MASDDVWKNDGSDEFNAADKQNVVKYIERFQGKCNRMFIEIF